MTRRVVLLLVVLVGAFASVVPAAAAQTSDDCVVDPYGGGQQCPPDPPECKLVQEILEPGDRVRVQGSGFVPDQDINGFFDGELVFSLHTDDGSFDVTFDIPERGPGTYNVVIQAENGQSCDPPIVIRAKTEVLGGSFARNDGRTASGGSSASGGGTEVLGRTFAKTGIAVATLVALGLLLVVAGRALRRGARVRSAP